MTIHINKLLEPVREYFNNNKEARDLLKKSNLIRNNSEDI